MRSMSLGVCPMALGLSMAVHAAVLLGPTRRAGASHSASDETVDVDLLANPEPVPNAPDSDRTLASPVDRAPRGPVRTQPSPVAKAASVAPVLVSDATKDDTPRFMMAVGAAATAGDAVASPSSGDLPQDEGAPGRSVDVVARLVRGLPPQYPDGARADGIEGDVLLEIVVGVSGAVESARIVRGVGHGLDEAALRSVHQFRFAPAMQGSRPVRVRMDWSVQFRLQ
jgi:protein TonB